MGSDAPQHHRVDDASYFASNSIITKRRLVSTRIRIDAGRVGRFRTQGVALSTTRMKDDSYFASNLITRIARRSECSNASKFVQSVY